MSVGRDGHVSFSEAKEIDSGLYWTGLGAACSASSRKTALIEASWNAELDVESSWPDLSVRRERPARPSLD